MRRNPSDPPRGLARVPHPPWGHAPRMQKGGIRAQPPRAHATKQVGRRAHSSRRRSRRRLQNSRTERRPPTPPHAASRAPTRTSPSPPQRAAVPSPKSPPARPARRPRRPDVRPSRSARRPGRRAHTCEAKDGTRAERVGRGGAEAGRFGCGAVRLGMCAVCLKTPHGAQKFANGLRAHPPGTCADRSPEARIVSTENSCRGSPRAAGAAACSTHVGHAADQRSPPVSPAQGTRGGRGGSRLASPSTPRDTRLEARRMLQPKVGARYLRAPPP
jgi:hypothetical protein